MYNNSWVIFHMKNSNLLITTAMLTAVFETSNKDAIDLIVPFVLNIISNGNNAKDIVNDRYIKDKLNQNFSFQDFPLVVLRIIINRLKKGLYIEKKSEQYFLKQNVDIQIKDFDKRMLSAKEDSDFVIDKLYEFLKINIKDITRKDTETYFTLFLKKNGYSIFADIDAIAKIHIKKDQANYFIGQFILENYKSKNSLFERISKIVQGFMLATAVYVQIESDNNAKFDKLECYFDAPFVLRILGFKTDYMNDSANELVKLLKNNGARLKCFKHNYSEVENILEIHIKNYGKPSEKTLEGLDYLKYNQTELQLILEELPNRFKEIGLDVVETPNYEESDHKKLIGEKELTQMLKDNYREIVSDKTIDNDVKSVSAITRIRKGGIFRKLEDSKAIFITTNSEIRSCINSLLNVNEKFQISPAVSDLDITAVVWLKSLKTSNDLSIMKLIENARAALEPTPSIIKQFNESIGKLKDDPKISTTEESLGTLLMSRHFTVKFMENIDGSDKNVNCEIILKTYEDTVNENLDIKDRNVNLASQIDTLTKQLLEKEEKERKEKEERENKVQLRSEKKSKIIIIGIKLVSVIIWLLLTGYLLYILIEKELLGIETLNFKYIMLIAFLVFSTIATLFAIIKYWFKFLNGKEVYICEYFKKKYLNLF